MLQLLCEGESGKDDAAGGARKIGTDKDLRISHTIGRTASFHHRAFRLGKPGFPYFVRGTRRSLLMTAAMSGDPQRKYTRPAERKPLVYWRIAGLAGRTSTYRSVALQAESQRRSHFQGRSFPQALRLRTWAKETEDCWRRLEKGNYNWAHIAYKIWPDKVRDACRRPFHSHRPWTGRPL
jgi:hypothetical protein